MGEKGYKPIGWRAASKYTKRAVYIRKESNGDLLEVATISKRGPNLWVTTTDGHAFLVDRSRQFFTRTRIQ
jgi:hypothetical protein